MPVVTLCPLVTCAHGLRLLACLFLAAALVAGEGAATEPAPLAPEAAEDRDASSPPAAIEDPAPAAPEWGPLEILGESIAPGEARGLQLKSHDSFTAGLVALRGAGPGPTLCVTAGIHGDELNGVAIARRLVDETDPQQLLGSLVIIPIVNTHGFRNGSRYLPDRRDLNRYFPGNRRGSAASRIARHLFEQLVRHCHALVDLHTGSLNRTNLPQIRADLRAVPNLRLAWGFGVEHVVHSVGQAGTLRRSASDAGLPAVVYEAGEPLRFDPEEIERGVGGIQTLLESLGMAPRAEPRERRQRHYTKTSWVRANEAGIYVPAVALGQSVERGDVLADISDPFSSRKTRIRSPRSGRVIGMAVGQVVIPGFALFHLGEEDSAAPGAEENGNGAELHAAEPAADSEGALRTELLEERPE